MPRATSRCRTWVVWVAPGSLPRTHSPHATTRVLRHSPGRLPHSRRRRGQRRRRRAATPHTRGGGRLKTVLSWLSGDWFTANEYWSSRLVFQRMLAAVYLVAFICALNQFRALLGERGLTPIPEFLRGTPFRRAPSLFQLHYSDRFFAAVSWTGIAVSVSLLVGVADLLPVWACLLLWALPWVLYLSIVNVGQIWYSFGWESLLLETGFIAIFLGPAHTGVPVLVLWLLLWLLFRLEFGAGLIKLRGDTAWRDLTALHYHHETQPMPGPLSWFFHHLPGPLHKVEVLANHVTQLVVPVLLLAPQPVAMWAAAVVVVTQLWLVLSGNFAWLNWVTIVLAFSAVSDDVVSGLVPSLAPDRAYGPTPLWFAVVVVAVGAVLLVLSWWPARNLFSRWQRMNASFNAFHLMGAYGAF